MSRSRFAKTGSFDGSKTGPTGRFWWFTERFFPVAAFGLVFPAFLLFLFSAFEWFRYRYGNITESIVMTAVLGISERPFLYKHFGEGAMTACPYAPGYLYLTYLVSLLTGKSFLCGRIVSLIFFLLMLWVLYRILRLRGATRFFSLTMTLMIGGLGTLHSFLAMADVTALCFNLFGIYCFMRWGHKAKAAYGRYFILGVSSFALAYLTKQSYVTGMAAVTLYFLYRARWRDLTVFLVAQCLAILAPSVVLNALTHGAYYENTVLMNRGWQYSWRLFFLHWVYDDPPRKIVFFLVFSFCFVLGKLRKHKAGLLEIYFLIVFACTLALGINGSGENYFIEIFIASCLMFALCFRWMVCFEKRPRVAFLSWIFFLTQLTYFYSSGFFVLKSPPPEVIRQKDAISKIIQRVHGDILMEDMGVLVANNRPVVYEPFEYTQLARKGLFDEKKILSRLEHKDFALVILDTNLFTEIAQSSRFSLAFTRCLRANYRPYGALGGYLVAVPQVSWPKAPGT